jgi:Zn-finger nucleic acid-binding protein
LGAVRVDGCDGCGGVWFDHQELTTVARTQTAQLQELEDRFQPRAAAPERPSQMNCPTCQVELFEFEFKHSPGIKLDGCRKCQGIWVDDGELAAIYRRLVGEPAAAPTPPAAPPDIRQKARQALGFLTTVACPGCQQPNPTASLTCWACGVILKGKRGFLCPRCDQPLTGEVHLDMHLDLCDDCGGVWLDAGEFPALMRHGPEELRRWERELGQPTVNLDAAMETRQDLLCPLCSLPLKGRPYAGASGIRLDNCPKCKGMWVDAGELSLVVEFLAREEAYRVR